MFATVKKNRTVDAGSRGQIPATGKVEANTTDWRNRVSAELEKRPRGEQARIVEYVQRWYPKFSTGTMSGLLADDEVPGQQRYSRYIPLINAYLWPKEAPIDEALLRELREMDPREQRALAEFIAARRKQS